MKIDRNAEIIPDGFLLSLLLLAIFLTLARIIYAAAPNPGHNFSEISGGVSQGDILFGSSTDTLSVLSKNTSGTRYLSNTGSSNNPAWSLVDLTSGVTGILPSTNGGTGNGFFKVSGPATSEKTFTLPNASATILTSNDAVTVAQGGTGLTATTDDGVFVGDSSSAMTSRTLPSCSNSSTSKLLYDNSTNTFSCGTDQNTGTGSISTVVTRPILGSGTSIQNLTNSSITSYKVALFNVPQTITVNQLTYGVNTVTTAGSYRICIYSEDGNTKHIDVTDVPTVGVNPVTVSPAVTLNPGSYYIAMGCATTCNNTIGMFFSIAVTWINTTQVPAGKKEYEGTVVMPSGTCSSTFNPTAISGSTNNAPVIRLDN